MATMTKTAVLLALTATLTLGAAAPALADCALPHDGTGHHGTGHHGTGHHAAIPHPTAPDAVVIHIEHSPNGWGGEYPEGAGVTIYGDGRIVIVPPSGAGRNGPPLPEATVLHVTEDGIQRALRAAKRAGLLRDTDYGEAGVTDQGTSVFEITTQGEPRITSVYALLLEEGDRGLTHKQRANREALRQLSHDVTDADFYERTSSTR